MLRIISIIIFAINIVGLILHLGNAITGEISSKSKGESFISFIVSSLMVYWLYTILLKAGIF